MAILKTNKDYNKRYYWKHRTESIKRVRKWQKENPEKKQRNNQRWNEKHPNYQKQYNQRKEQKIRLKKSTAKRKRNLGFIQLFENPFDESEQIDWHHINNTFVVAIPQNLHQMYRGKYHRERVKYIVEQVYGNIED